MSHQPQGRLVPIGGGDPIPLRRAVLKIGRRESCDICLKFPSISSQHCELTFKEGYWSIRDLGSTNGIKVNSERVNARALRPGDEVSIAKQRYTIQYDLPASAAQALEDIFSSEDIMGQSLLEKAGLAKRRAPQDEDTDE